MSDQKLIQYVAGLIQKFKTRDLTYTGPDGLLNNVSTDEKFAALLVEVILERKETASVKAT